MSYEIETEIAQDNSEGRYANCFEGTKKRHVAGQCVRPQEPAPVFLSAFGGKIKPKTTTTPINKATDKRARIANLIAGGPVHHKTPLGSGLSVTANMIRPQPTNPPPPQTKANTHQ